MQEIQERWVRSLGQEYLPEKEMEPTPTFLPRTFHGQRNLASYSPWGCKKSDTPERTHTHTSDKVHCIEAFTVKHFFKL